MYFAVNVRRLARSGTSGSGRRGPASATCPASAATSRAVGVTVMSGCLHPRPRVSNCQGAGASRQLGREGYDHSQADSAGSILVTCSDTVTCSTITPSNMEVQAAKVKRLCPSFPLWSASAATIGRLRKTARFIFSVGNRRALWPFRKESSAETAPREQRGLSAEQNRLLTEQDRLLAGKPLRPVSQPQHDTACPDCGAGVRRAFGRL